MNYIYFMKLNILPNMSDQPLYEMERLKRNPLKIENGEVNREIRN